MYMLKLLALMTKSIFSPKTSVMAEFIEWLLGFIIEEDDAI